MITRRDLIKGTTWLIASVASNLGIQQNHASAGSIKLFTWARPVDLPGAPFDHTWVTTYDNRINVYNDVNAVLAAGESYWYAWGDFHPQGGTPQNASGFLGDQLDNLETAQCIARANADCRNVAAARGTIFAFCIDGVCHQLTSQILYAGKTIGMPPLTVKDARGYPQSSFIYGPYGLQENAWRRKIETCAGGAVLAANEGLAAPKLPDDFEARARSVLKGRDEQVLERLLRLRAEAQNFLNQKRIDATPPSAEVLNEKNQQT